MKKIIAFVIAVCMISSYLTLTVAAVTEVVDRISTRELTRIATLPKYNGCGIVGGFGSSRGRNSMFVLKTNGADNLSKFFYFPNIDNPSNYRVFTIENIGHAGAMAIDSENIYITKRIANNTQPSPNNQIIKIPRSVISGTPDGDEISADDLETEDVDGYTIFQPMKLNPDLEARGEQRYVPYTSDISAITIKGGDGKFIIRCNSFLNDGDDDFGFTTAIIDEYNGEELFVVNTDSDSRFIIKNTLAGQDTVAQDICYEAGRGFFIPVWYRDTYEATGENRAKNVIVWANIDEQNCGRKIVNGVEYRYYTPVKINVDMNKVKDLGVPIYQKLEFESLDFTVDGEMLVACNVNNTEAYLNAYSGKPPADGVFKLTHSNGQNFTLPLPVQS